MLPLARYRTPTDPLLFHADGRISAGLFFAQAQRLSQALPTAPYVINLCHTRHGFMLGFAAALLRGQTSLLPAGQGRGDREQVQQQFPGATLLCENSLPDEQVFALAPYIADHSPQRGQIPPIDGRQQAAVLFTSGSTGRPSAHAKTWEQLCHGAESLIAALGWERFPSSAVVGSVPPQHMFGLETTVMLPWIAGVPVHAQKPLLPADLEQVLRQSDRPCWWMTTPLHLRPPLHALQGLAGVVASTMALPANAARAAESAWLVPVIEIYGSTETGALATRRTAREETWTPLADVVLKRDGERCIAAGGHVGPAIPLNDRLEVQADGCFRWLGRATDLIKVGGKRASLTALNQALAAIPGVIDGVYFVPTDSDDSHPARRLAAFYVSPSLTPPEVLHALRARIDPVFLPRPLHRVAQLPRNASGKLPQVALAELFAQCHARPAPRIVIPADHPCLPGHFPGNPMAPGALILARVADILRATFPRIELGELITARFLAPLRPDEEIEVHMQLQDGRVRFTLQRKHAPHDEDNVIASGQWACRPTPCLPAAKP